MAMDATKAALNQIWSDDLLDRRDDAEFLIAFLINRVQERGERRLPRSYVLNVDSGWGHGKTFFLERLGRSLSSIGHPVALVNAWRDDHAEDPLLSVMAAIDSVISSFIGEEQQIQKTWQSLKQTAAAVALAAVKGAAIHWSKKVVGEGVDAALEQISNASGRKIIAGAEESIEKEMATIIDQRAKSLMKGFEETQRSMQVFRMQLKAFLEKLGSRGINLPLFVLVDELDRCRPTYAVTLLERIKHLFEIDNVVFVAATDTAQLQHAIRAVYGSEFDSPRYLSRFFDRTYRFGTPSLEAFVGSLIERAPLAANKVTLPYDVSAEHFFAGAFRYFGLSLRDAEQVYELVRTIVTVWESKMPIELMFLLPLAIGHQQHIDLVWPSLRIRLNELRAKTNAESDEWTTEVQLDLFSRSGPTTIQFYELFHALTNFLGSALPDIPVESGDHCMRWAASRFKEEFRMIHGNQYNSGSKPHSILRNYPNIIRSAGRLAIS